MIGHIHPYTSLFGLPKRRPGIDGFPCLVVAVVMHVLLAFHEILFGSPGVDNRLVM